MTAKAGLAQVQRWAESPLDFVLEGLFQIDRSTWKPWVPGTPRPIEAPPGPELWQGNLLLDIEEAGKLGKRRFAVRSGHGVGKTTIQSWIILWFLLFHRPVNVPVTANSQDQLRDVVWKEIGIWHQKLPDFLRRMLELKVERIEVAGSEGNCFAVARTARPEKPEALQGFHCETLAFLAEEASGIEDIIFEVASGALSDEDNWFFMFGNPTRLDGYFHRAFTDNREHWRTYHVPCDSSYRQKPSYADEMAREYGVDSNVYRIRVLGEFPLAEDNSVMSLAVVESAIERDVELSPVSAVVWGLDVARFGDDSTALAKRKGNWLLAPVQEWKHLDLMQVVGKVAKEYNETPLEHRPQSINVDVIGLGAGVVDRGREIGLPMRPVNVGERAGEPERYMRLRDELWFKAREWFEQRDVRIPKDDKLIKELIQPHYKLESSGKIKVESKDEMKERGLKSPNVADAFNLTLAGGDFLGLRRNRIAVSDYDPFEMDHATMNEKIRRREVSDYDPFEVM